jgi:hypothetical protein
MNTITAKDTRGIEHQAYEVYVDGHRLLVDKVLADAHPGFLEEEIALFKKDIS